MSGCHWLLSSILLGLLLTFVHSFKDPYKVLGVDRKADIPTVKRAYKLLAKTWHPDKNPSDEAKNRFVEISSAYELLTDPDRRRRFDLYGIVEDSPNFPRRHSDNPFYDERFDDPVDFAAHKQHFRFSFNGFEYSASADGTSRLRRDAISLRRFERHILPASWREPTLLLTFIDWCPVCAQTQVLWTRLSEQLAAVGVAAATVHVQLERQLAARLGASDSHAPQLFLLIEGRQYLYSGELSFSGVVEFVRERLLRLSSLVTRLTSVDLAAEFLSDCRDNRVRVIVYSQSEVIKLRYVVLAFKYRSFAATAFVFNGSPDVEVLLSKHNVLPAVETVNIFKETRNVVASLSMGERLSFDDMSDLLEQNKFLLLPRLSSQLFLDLLCPVEASRSQRHLCVVFVLHSGADPSATNKLIQHILQSSLRSRRARYVYFFYDKQPTFWQAIREGCPNTDSPSGHVLIVWRRSESALNYEWLPPNWSSNESVETNNSDKSWLSFESIDVRLRQLLTSHDPLSKHVEGPYGLQDEHAAGLLRRVLARLYNALDFIRERISRDQLLPALSVAATVAVLAAGGYLMSHLAKLEEANVQRQYRSQGGGGGFRSSTACSSSGTSSPQLRIHELRTETFNGLVRLLKPGCRTLVLMVDSDSRDKLVSQYRRIVWPYRRNRTLMFAFMLLERGLEWYRRLLQPHLPDDRQLNINPKNCIGTVISINGHRKYFCMYHAKHAETAGRRRVTRRQHRRSFRSAGGGDFLGFNSTDDSGASDVEKAADAEEDWMCHSDDDVLFEKQLLDALPDWLDRLFEGQTIRYHMNFWPDFIGK